MVNVWDPTEPYDVLRPNDYNEYKVWKQKERIERRERRLREDRKRSRYSDYSDSEGTPSDDERPRKAGEFCGTRLSVKSWTEFVHWLGRYDESFDHWSRADDERRSPRPNAQPVTVDVNLTGDEAYQRRLALSVRVNAPDPQLPDEVTESSLPLPMEQPVEGEEAYVQALAPTVFPRQPSPPPLAFNPFAPPPAPPPPPGGPGALPDASEAKLKAAAIAARLSALAGNAPEVSSPAPEPEEKRLVLYFRTSSHMFV